MVKLTRQQKRKIGRDSIKVPVYTPWKEGTRQQRRHQYDVQNDVVNQRASTLGRTIINQHMYNIMDTNGSVILAFGSITPILTKSMIPKKIKDRIYKICYDKKKLKQMREMKNIVRVNTIRHIVPTAHMVKVQKLIIENYKPKG